MFVLIILISIINFINALAGNRTQFNSLEVNCNTTIPLMLIASSGNRTQASSMATMYSTPKLKTLIISDLLESNQLPFDTNGSN